MRRFQCAALGAVAVFGFISAALAADLPVKAPPIGAAAPVYNWTGFYIGANGGYGWKDPTVSFSPNDSRIGSVWTGLFGSTPPGPASFNTDGGLGGLQAGYNWQFNQKWLLGLEADFDWSAIKGNGTSSFLMYPTVVGTGGPANIQASQNVDWFGTVRVRLGFLPTSNTLVYATGGLAYGHIGEQVTLNGVGFIGAADFGFFCTSGSSVAVKCFAGSSSRTELGWTIGGGLEYAPWNNNITLRAEYLYINLGGGDTVNVVALNSNGGAAPSSIAAVYNRTDFSVVRGGINWKF
jgi:outer membrane immunogenic protein